MSNTSSWLDGNNPANCYIYVKNKYLNKELLLPTIIDAQK